MPPTHEVPAPVRELAAQLAQPEPMRRGSLSERRVKCSKAGCRCAEDPQARHGPYFSLTRVVEGRTRSRFLSAEQASLVRRQIEAGHRFRRQVGAYWAACEQWADVQVKAAEGKGQPSVKKNRTRRSVGHRHRRGD
jgi:uncharacterized protein DUF6788